jgi:ubiquitin C-terminal hydrolase
MFVLHDLIIVSIMINTTGDGRVPGPGSMYEYDLFSVVCHEGSIDNGHYTCFTRHRDEVSTTASFLHAIHAES